MHTQFLGSSFHDLRGISSGTTTLVISNVEMEDIIKILNLLKILVCYQKELVKPFNMKQNKKQEHFSVCFQVQKMQVC